MARTTALPRRITQSERDRVLVTPEGVALPLTIASRGSRAGALLLDFVFLGATFVLLTIALVSLVGGVDRMIGGLHNVGASSAVLQFLGVVWLIATFLLRYAYFLFFELGARGATPGKRLTGIRIAARDGGRLTVEMVIARNLLRDIELFLPVLFIISAQVDSTPAWLVATAWFAMFLLFPCFNRDRLRAGDVIAGTWVVEAPRRKLEAAMTRPAPMPASGPTYQFTNTELAVYGEFELQSLERILRENRKAAIESVQQTIAGKIGRDPWVPEPRAFLEAYYAQLRARLEAGMRMGRRKADKHSGAI